MANPSLLIIPDRYKAAKLYSQLPESGDGDFVVTRGTTATRVNASGLIESVASGVPRLDYTGGGCPSLLVEPAATNLVLRSQEFDNASWQKAEALVTSDATAAPDGTLTADKLIATAVTNLHQAFQSGWPASGVATFSTYAKASEYNFVVLRITALNANTWFDLSAGTVGTIGAGVTAKIEEAGNGWYRCIVSATSTGSGNVAIEPAPSNGVRSYLGDDASGIFIWGAQLETGSVATSYIPTVASTVTRNADVISLSSVSGLIGQTEGTLYVKINLSMALGATARNIFWISNQTSINNSIGITIGGTLGSNLLAARIWENSVLKFRQSSTSPQGIVKIAFAYESGNCALYVNGNSFGSPATNLSFTLSGLNVVQLGSFLSGAEGLNDRISAAAIYTSRLSNSELQSLTTL